MLPYFVNQPVSENINYRIHTKIVIQARRSVGLSSNLDCGIFAQHEKIRKLYKRILFLLTGRFSQIRLFMLLMHLKLPTSLVYFL